MSVWGNPKLKKKIGPHILAVEMKEMANVPVNSAAAPRRRRQLLPAYFKTVFKFVNPVHQVAQVGGKKGRGGICLG
jgi:hypothetical protein